jgi:ABC-type lipoprotein export system ATPase subunit
MFMCDKRFLRGSEWRKWDLHFHTQSSYDYKDKSITNEQLIQTLIDKDISVVAVTDHHFIDVERIKQLQKLAGDRVVILPSIEFCSDLGGSESIHFIAIFPENSDIESIWTTLQGKLELTPSDIRRKGGLENIQCDLVDTCDIVHELGGITSIHAGTKTNTVENIKNTLVAKMQQKTRILSDCIDILELGKVEDIAGYKEVVFRSIGFALPMIICSDNHDIKNYEIKQNCWIKADPTFEGLKQILYEPEERVRIQATNPTFDFEKSPFTEILINEDIDVFEDEQDNVRFEKCSLLLNNDLVSIIGGRGTGKSILIDYISAGLGQKIKNKNYTKSDKITIKRQTSLKEDAISFVLSDNPNVQFMYISQSEIKSIVEKPKDFTKNIRETIGVIDDYFVSKEYKEKADEYINKFFGVIKILEANDTNSSQKKENIGKEIKRYNDFIANITSQENKPKLENYQRFLNALANRKAFYEKIQNQKIAIEQFQYDINNKLQQINEALSKNNLDVNIPLINNSDTINYISQLALPKIQELIDVVENKITNIKNTFSDYTGDLATLLNDVALYQNKVTELEEQKKIIEDNETTFTIIKNNYFKELGSEIVESINAYKSEIENNWLNFKSGSSDYTDEQKKLLSDILGEDNLNVVVEVNFDKERMYQLLMQKLDGRSWTTEKLERTLNVNDLNSFINFIKQTAITNTFSEEINPIRRYVLDVFFRRYDEFITHNIVVTSRGKNITKLSHGQQGTIYLRLKLAANLFSKTIIYDQPEDDLDNEFIMSDLVSIFRKIKKYRQVIIVSHNANLVVNADSEQVIIANNEDGVLKYTSGSLENPAINKQICKILEGGKSAFLNREKKYGFK